VSPSAPACENPPYPAPWIGNSGTPDLFAHRQFSGVGEVPCYVRQAGVRRLAGPDEQLERLNGGELVALHQDALRLPDEIPDVGRDLQLLDSLSIGHGDGGMRGEQGTYVLRV
jgi:hypothetical protein